MLPPGVTYGGVGRAAGGRWGALAVDVSLVLSQCGFCCVYISFVARNMMQLMNSGSGPHACWVHAPWLWLFVLLELPLLAPLSWVRRLHSFGPSNIVADVFIVGGLAAVLAYSIVGMAQKPPLGGQLSLPAFSSGWPVMVGTAVYAFEGVGMVLPMINALPRAQRAGFPRILNASLVGVALAYIIVGLVPYVYLQGFAGVPVQDAITLNLPRTWWSFAVTGGYCVALLLSYPYMLHPAMAIMEAAALPYLFPKAAAAAASAAAALAEAAARGAQPEGLLAAPDVAAAVDVALGSSGRVSRAAKWTKNAFRTGVVGVTLLVSYVGSSQLDNFVSLIGAFACTPIAFILPALFHALLFGGSVGGGVRVYEPLAAEVADSSSSSGDGTGGGDGAAGDAAAAGGLQGGQQQRHRKSRLVIISDWVIVVVGVGIMAFSTYECIAGWHSSTFDPCPAPVTQ